MKNCQNISKKSLNFLSFVLFLLGMLFFGVNLVFGAEPEVVVKDSEYYSTKFVSQSEKEPIIMEFGEKKTIILKFKNTGKATWNSSPARFVSGYTMEPRYRVSKFKGANWLSGMQTAKISGVVKPGQIGELKLDLKAPDKAGDYLEKFYLSAESYSWIEGGYFYLKIKVVPAKKTVTPKTDFDKDSVQGKKETAVVNTTSEAGYKLHRVILSPKEIVGKGGQQARLIVSFQNTGTKSWKSFSFESTDKSYFDSSWSGENIILKGIEDVGVDKSLRREFYFRLPSKQGSYETSFVLKIDDGALQENIVVPVTVTEDAVTVVSAPVVSGPIVNIKLASEPRLRVGISAPDGDFIQFRSYEDDYKIISGGVELGILPMRKFAVIKFVDGKYNFSAGELLFDSNNYFRLEPINNPHAVFIVINLSRPAKWVRPGLSFNQYHGAMEYRMGDVEKSLYIVNDLLLEDYVKGMAENSAQASMEFLKTNLTAARNYAYVNIGKYPFFDVVGNTFDQLYLGYEAEQVLPNVVLATEATRGVFVTYNDQIVTTPYFGNSNGKTKSFSSVWGGANKPWLVPVTANYDSGKRQLGHGVGMSQMDAFLRAREEGLDYISLLKYYYSGVEVEKIYE